uniref:F-box protein 44 n=1 Tax=Panthera tigris altaica TaxID=74533 RepID=A0A8C9KCA4_PANTA
MAVGNINELPENILLELFTHVPARQLLLRCRLVRRLWGTCEKGTTEGLPYDVSSAFWPEGFEFWSLDVNGGDEWKVENLSGDQRKEFPNDQSWGGGKPKVLGGADGHHTAGHRGQGLVRSQARLRVQVPAVCSAPVVSTCAAGDLPARPGDNPAEERCQVEGGLSHVLQLPTRRPLHLVSARRRGHSLLGRLVRPEGHQQQHHHRAPTALTPPKP